MNATFINALADEVGDLITHIGIVDSASSELSGGTYARVGVTWTAASSGMIQPSSNLTFNIPASTTLGGWRGYSASASGTDYGGAVLYNKAYVDADTFILIAAETTITVA
jgi:hypothetical protein